MENNLLVPLMNQEDRDALIHAAQEHVKSIITVYTLGISWLKDETEYVLGLIHGKYTFV